MNELTWAQIAQLCSFSIMMAAGQVLFKLAAAHAPVLNTFSSLLSLFSNYWLWGALTLYGISTILWMIVLQNVSLSVAYPFVALGFVVVPLASYVVFKEPLNWQYGVGILLILVALKLITGSSVGK